MTCSYNHFHNVLRLFDILPNFPLPAQVKRSAIISNKNGIYELPNDLKEKKFHELNYELNFVDDSLVHSLPAKMKILLVLAKISCKTEIKLFL